MSFLCTFFFINPECFDAFMHCILPDERPGFQVSE
jgi:hypothetical protein